MMLAFSACGTFLIHSGFKSAREKDIQNGYNNASVVCINLVQNVKRTINLVYRDTGYEKQKNVVVRQAAQSVSVRNAGEEVQFALWTDEKIRIYSTNRLKESKESICRDELEAGQEGYKIVKQNGRYVLYTGTSFEVLDRIYYVETFSDITRDYENRDAQLRMFRVIMIIVMIVCLMLMAILNNMIVVPIRRLSKATKLVAGGRAGIRIRKRSKDEIGVLAEDFNRMSTSLNRTMKELEEKTKSQEMFTNNFAHELKTPLMAIQGYAEGIQAGVMDAGGAAEVILEESDRMTELVEELLDISKIDMGRQQLALSEMDVRELLYDSIRAVEPTAAASGITIVPDFPEEPVMFSCDDTRLRRAVTNILSNGVRYARSELRLTCRADKRHVTIRIQDDGDGIAEEDLPHIFDRFYMGKSGKSGIGLALTKEIIHLHKGTIRAYNGDTGAVFEISIPVSR